jgi:hypothetical protein
LYFVNAWVDASLIGGVSVLAFLLFYAFHDGQNMGPLYGTAAVLTIFANHPHFFATNYRLYHSRSNIRQFPMTALVAPVLVGAGMIASLAYPDTVAPYYVKLFMLWSPYHFSGQSVGISMIYARRAGFQIGKWERRALSGFIFGAFIATLLTYDTSLEGIEYYGMYYPGLGLPLWTVTAATIFMYVCGAGLLGLAIRWSVKNKRVLPPIVLLPALTHYVWFLGGTLSPGFQEFVPFFHSVQYLLVAWTVQLKESSDARRAGPSTRFVIGQSLRWMVINIAGGYALFELLPYLFSTDASNLYFTSGLVAAAVQMHHFFVDGVIWKLKGQTKGSPVMANLHDFLGREAPGPRFTARAEVAT